MLKAWGVHPEREIGEVREDGEESAINYFVERFQDLEAKVTEVEKIIEESTNKGSFLMKLLHLKEVIQTHDGLGDYLALQTRLENQEALLNDIIHKNRERNTELKKVLIEEAKVAVEKINWKEATAEIHEIKTRWIKTGNATEKEQPQLEEAFWSVVSGFFEKKKAFYEDKKRLGEKTKAGYQDLVKKAQNLNTVHGKERFEKVKELKQKWADLGNIPKEEYAPLIDAFNHHLKPNQPAQAKQVDLESILTELDECLAGKKEPKLPALEEYRNLLKNYRPNEYAQKQARKEAFNKIQLLKEQDFLRKMASKRFKDYKDLANAQKRALEIKILEDLLLRDREDLVKYIENSENFTSASGEMNPMVEKKLNQQKTKVAVKEKLLEMLKNA